MGYSYEKLGGNLDKSQALCIFVPNLGKERKRKGEGKAGGLPDYYLLLFYYLK